MCIPRKRNIYVATELCDSPIWFAITARCTDCLNSRLHNMLMTLESRRSLPANYATLRIILVHSLPGIFEWILLRSRWMAVNGNSLAKSHQTSRLCLVWEDRYVLDKEIKFYPFQTKCKSTPSPWRIPVNPKIKSQFPEFYHNLLYAFYLSLLSYHNTFNKI